MSIGYFVLEGLIIRVFARKYNSEFTLVEGTACAYYCCFYRMLTLGSGGGIAQIYYLNKRGVPAARATGMGLIQYVLQRVSIAVYGLLCVLIFFREVRKPLEGYKMYLLVGSLLVVAVVAALIFVATSEVIFGKLFLLAKKIIKNRTSWLSRLDRLKEQVAILQCESRELLREKRKLTAVLCINIIKLTFWYMVPFVACYPDPGLTWRTAVSLTALSFMLAGVIPAPAGMGSVEVVFILLFTRVISSAKAVSAMLLLRFATNGVPVVVGGVCSLLLKRKEERGV